MIAIFPEISAAAQSGDVEQLAVLVRKYFCGEKATTPNADMEALLKRFGIPVTRMPLKDYGMIAVRDERGSVLCSIAIRDNLDAVEDSFMLAHLLGHFLIHIQPRIARTEWTSSGYREEQPPTARYTHAIPMEQWTAQQYASEDLADRFAAALMMPAAMFKRAGEKLNDAYKVANLFGVTSALVERRLEDLMTPPAITVRPAAKSAPQPAKQQGQGAAATSNAAATPTPSQEDTAHMVRERHHQAAPTPRAVAAQSYGSNANSEEPAKQNLVSGKGMERLREIARMLDKTGR